VTTARFPLGKVVATPAALAALGDDRFGLLARHQRGDWGEVCAEDVAENEQGVTAGRRIVSAYTVNGTKIWILTEWDRSATTIMLPEEW
jgi:hypothetical protein